MMAARWMLSFLLLIIVAAMAVPVRAADGWPASAFARGPALGDIWKDCSKPSDPLRINKIIITPDPPVPGKQITFFGNFTIEEEVTGGEVALSLEYAGLPFDEHYRICDIVQQVNRTCPLEIGELVLKISYDIPAFIPSGHVTGKVLLTDQKEQELACISLDFNV